MIPDSLSAKWILTHSSGLHISSYETDFQPNLEKTARLFFLARLDNVLFFIHRESIPFSDLHHKMLFSFRRSEIQQ
jgi:hypothetical protein